MKTDKPKHIFSLVRQSLDTYADSCLYAVCAQGASLDQAARLIYDSVFASLVEKNHEDS